MSNEYKQCPNGHYYQGDHCPYCKSSNESSSRTEVFGMGNDQMGGGAYQGNNGATEVMPVSGGMGGGSGASSTVVMGDMGNMGNAPVSQNAPMPSNHTVFGEEMEVDPNENGQPVNAGGNYRMARKLVGWLVSYSLDALGMDFKLYEGRNIIGRDADCNITVNDNMISGKHAVLLFRAGKYSLTDSQSSHGTFVNDQDIELEPKYLNDGDIIRMGKTVFKFRTSL